MPDEHGLEGVRCPACGNDERFWVAVTAFAEVTDSGPEDFRDVNWSEESDILCPRCNASGRVADFRATSRPLS